MKKLLNKIFGQKYYIVIARDKFRLHEFCVGHIFRTFDGAASFMAGLPFNTMSNIGLEVHSFRSRRNLNTYESKFGE